MLQRGIERRAGEPERGGGHADPALVEAAKGHRLTVTARAQQLSLGVGQAKLRRITGPEPAGGDLAQGLDFRAVHQESTDLLPPLGRLPADGNYHQDIRHAAEGDVALETGEFPPAAGDLGGRGLHAAAVAARFRFGQGPCRQPGAAQ